MALIKCPECGREVSDKAVSCPQCGYPIASMAVQETPKKPVTFWRKRKSYGSAIHAVVYIDDVRVGTVDNDEEFTVNLKCGEHTVAIESSSQINTVNKSLVRSADVLTNDRVKIFTLEVPKNAKRVEVECAVSSFFSLTPGYIEVIDINVVR